MRRGLGTGEFANVSWVGCFVSGAGLRRVRGRDAPATAGRDAGATGCGGGCGRVEGFRELGREVKIPTSGKTGQKGAPFYV